MESSNTSFLKPTEKIVENNTSKLAEKLTGFKIENPRIYDRLISDHENVQNKYQLPQLSELVYSPENYYQKIKTILTDNNISLYKSTNNDVYFKNNPNLIASYFPDTKSILVNENCVNNNPHLLLATITHETIHALQDINEPNLSIEQKEYEAHVGSLPLSYYNEDSRKNLIDVNGIFNGIIESVDSYNKQINN